MAFLGLSHSYEQFYQAIRRIYRFGQKRECHIHVIVSDRDGAIIGNIKRKQLESDRLTTGLIQAMTELSRAEIGSSKRETVEYKPTKKMIVPQWLKS